MSRNARVANANPVTQPVPVERHRFHLLDALRGLAAILVVTFHAPSGLKYFLLFPNSFLAVDFFFCLSGFVIAFSYEERLRKSLTLRDFLVVRLIRLYPVYALSVAFSLLRALNGLHLVSQLDSRLSVAALAAMAILLVPNLFLPAAGTQIFPLNSPAWSLWLELVANLVYGCLFLRRGIARIALPLICLTSLGFLAFLAFHRSTLDFGTARQGMAFGFARVGFSFTAGVLLYRLFSRRPGRLNQVQSRLGSVVAVGLLLAVLTASGGWAGTGRFQLLAVAVLFPALVYLGANCTVPRRLDGMCAFLGEMSYPLYILHLPLMLPNVDPAVVSWLRHPGILPYILPVYITLLVIASWWISHSIDVPLRRRLTSAYKSFLSSRVPSSR